MKEFRVLDSEIISTPANLQMADNFQELQRQGELK